VIDDGDSVRDIIRIFLERDGFEVCGEAADGVEGVEQAKKLQPDLIVLDLAMPRMNGVETASILRQTMPDIPIILLTLYQNLIGPSLASAVGVKTIIDKTDGLDKLVACVHSLLKVDPPRKSAQRSLPPPYQTRRKQEAGARIGSEGEMTETAPGDVEKKCSRCGNAFHCKQEAGCWCASVQVERATLAEIRTRFADCLCEACLRKLAAPGLNDFDAGRAT